jgi:hypothetical protein
VVDDSQLFAPRRNAAALEGQADDVFVAGAVAVLYLYGPGEVLVIVGVLERDSVF